MRDSFFIISTSLFLVSIILFFNKESLQKKENVNTHNDNKFFESVKQQFEQSKENPPVAEVRIWGRIVYEEEARVLFYYDHLGELKYKIKIIEGMVGK